LIGLSHFHIDCPQSGGHRDTSESNPYLGDRCDKPHGGLQNETVQKAVPGFFLQMHLPMVEMVK
jgi:hypothetical protein